MIQPRKVCRSCLKNKLAKFFYVNLRNRDGLSSYCKRCSLAKARAYAIDPRRGRGHFKSARHAAWWSKFKASNGIPERAPHIEAHTEVTLAIRKGKMSRPATCSQCGVRCRPHAHHEDYNKPLDVVWLCALCHRRRHSKKTP